MEARTKRTFKFVFVTLFVDLLAFTLILPLLPKILDYYATNDKSNTYKLFDNNVKVLQRFLRVPESYNQVLLAGILGSWFSFLQFISSPFLGAMSDKFGRKSILLMAMSGSVASYVIWFIASNNFSLFILSRTVGGLSKANVGLSLAIVSDVSDESTRGRGMAMVGSSFSLAFIFGPLLGAYLSTMAQGGEHQLQNQLITNPSLIAIALSLINVALVVIFIQETNSVKASKLETKEQRKKPRSQQFNVLSRVFHYINLLSLFNFSLVKKLPKYESDVLRTTGLIYFYYLLFYSGLEFTLSFLTHIRFGFSSMDQGKLYLFSGLLMAIIQGGYVRRIKGGREAMMALIGLTMVIPSFILMGLSSRVTHIYFSLTMYAIASAIVVPCLTTIISTHCPVESRGVVMGTFRSIGALARAIGPGLASLLFWTSGPTICYVLGALALLIPHIMMKKLYHKMQAVEGAPRKKSVNSSVTPAQLAKAN